MLLRDLHSSHASIKPIPTSCHPAANCAAPVRQEGSQEDAGREIAGGGEEGGEAEVNQGPGTGAVRGGGLGDRGEGGVAGPLGMLPFHGSARLAVLPGREGVSGHAVCTLTRRCVGISAIKVIIFCFFCCYQHQTPLTPSLNFCWQCSDWVRPRWAMSFH